MHALIVFKLESERLEGKNVRPFLGAPLWLWSYRWALAEDLDPIVYVEGDGDFDSRGIEHIRVGKKNGSHMDAIRGAAEGLDGNEKCVLLQPTSPYRERGLAARMEKTIKDRPVISGVRKKSANGYSLFDSGVIYGFTPSMLYRHIVGGYSDIMPLSDDPRYCFDINTEADFKAMEAIYDLR